MQVQQIYQLVNNATKEVLGETAIVAEDLSNIVDIGTQIFDANKVDNYVKSLVDHIGKVIFVNRPYKGSIPSVLMDAWEFGSVVEKITAELPEVTENKSWELVNGQSYDPNVFYKPDISAKFFNSKVTFECDMSFTELQLKESFDSISQLNSFISMIYNAVEKAMTVRIDALVMRTINNMIGQTLHAEFPSVSDGDYSSSTGIKAVNLLKLYNDKFSKSLTAEKSMEDADFLKFASYTIWLYKGRLAKLSRLFNVGGKDRFTSEDYLNIVCLDNFTAGTSTYLESDTYHNELVKLPNYESVPYWQGSGTDYSFSNVSDIHVNIKDPEDESSVEIQASGIIAIMYDRESLGVCNTDRRVRTNYNEKAEFYSNFYKFDASYFNDLNENFVVFFVA